MHGETLKHALKDKTGEDDIYDTAGMAVCLGVVKNYTMYKVGADSFMSAMHPSSISSVHACISTYIPFGLLISIHAFNSPYVHSSHTTTPLESPPRRKMMFRLHLSHAESLSSARAPCPLTTERGWVLHDEPDRVSERRRKGGADDEGRGRNVPSQGCMHSLLRGGSDGDLRSHVQVIFGPKSQSPEFTS